MVARTTILVETLSQYPSMRYPAAVEFRPTRRQLLTPLTGLLLIGLILLLPDLAPGRRPDEVVQAYRGQIEAIVTPPPDNDPDTAPVPHARVRMLEGPLTGQTLDAFLSGPGGSQSVASYQAGDAVVVTVTDDQGGGGPVISVSDRWRIPPLELLVILFALAVVLVGGWHGVRALIALGLTIAVILKILLPLLIAGVPPVPLAVVTATAVTVVTILLTEGWNRASAAAILGTTGAIAITGLLGAAATAALGFTYTAGSDLAFLTTANGQGLDLRGILLAAIILGAVGVLDDVTVTQAVLVEELAETGGLRGSRLFASGMAIGRSHISATVNTLFLAYVGAGLPLLIVLLVSAQPGNLVFNDELIATEIVRTIVGSLGIIAAVPVTTWVATALIPADTVPGARRLSRRVVTAAAAGGITAVLLALTAALPLTAGPRPALAPDVFDPSAVPFDSTPPDAGLSSPDPGLSSPDPQLFDKNEPVPIDVDGQAVGTVTVLGWDVHPPQPPSKDSSITVDVRYTATSPMATDAGSWELLLTDGSEAPLSGASGGEPLPPALAAGETRDVRLEGSFATSEDLPFIAYVDTTTGDFVFLVSVE
jgi:uncharacterized membrane protein